MISLKMPLSRKTVLEISVSRQDHPFDANKASDVYRINGLPPFFNQPLTLKIRHYDNSFLLRPIYVNRRRWQNHDNVHCWHRTHSGDQRFSDIYRSYEVYGPQACQHIGSIAYHADVYTGTNTLT